MARFSFDQVEAGELLEKLKDKWNYDLEGDELEIVQEVLSSHVGIDIPSKGEINVYNTQLEELDHINFDQDPKR